MKTIRRILSVHAFGIIAALGQSPPPQEAPELITLPTGEKLFTWQGHTGRSYFLQVSDPTSHLEKWSWAPVIEGGADAEISYEVDGTADKGFFRIHHTDQIPGSGETLDTADFDEDGISNLGEINPPAGSQTHPLNPDTDGDGLPDGWEVWNGFDPNDDGSTDPDNGANGDPDGDGLGNLGEFQAGTDPYTADSDYDGIPDGWEVANGLDPLDWYAYGDPDSDGIDNILEYLLGFDPQDEYSDGTPDIDRDRDGDGMPDHWEALQGKWVWDYDQGDYVFLKTLDWEVADGNADPDLDSLANLLEYQNLTDPNDPDSDDDFMPDGWELQYNGMAVVISPGQPPAPAYTVTLDPNDPADSSLDPDGDGLSNIQEYRAGSLPHLSDSDGDGATDGDEVAAGADPGSSADGGVPGGAGSGTVVVEIPFAAGGDYAWWEMKIEGQGPTDQRVQRIHSNKDAASGYGDHEGEARMIKLHAGNSYKVTMKRMGGVDDDGTKWFCWSANVGTEPDTEELLPDVQTFPNYPQTSADRLAETAETWPVSGENEDGAQATWLIDNIQGLFTQHIDDYGKDVAQSLEAFLVPVEVSWQEFAGYGNVSDHIDPWDTNLTNGKRIFPGAKNPDESAILDKLELIVKTLSSQAGKTVYVKAFDVDDTTSEAFDLDETGSNPVIDTEGKAGGDNLNDYKQTPKNGQFWTGSAWGNNESNAVLDSNGEAKFTFGVGMQPGNNYRVVVALDDATQLASIQTSDSEAPHYLGSESLAPAGLPASPLLTVWRRLWVENDSMEAIPTDQYGYKRNDLESEVAIAGITDAFLEPGENNTWLVVPPVKDHTSFVDLSLPTKSKIIFQSESHPILTTANPGGITGSYHIKIEGDHTSVPLGSGFRIYDDDDYGLGSPPLPRTNFVNDQMKNYFRPSFIDVIDSGSYNSTDPIPFKSNEDISVLNPNTTVDDEMDLEDANSRWLFPITAAYQGRMDEDQDGEEGSTLGETAPHGNYGAGAYYDHSTVFIETCRESYGELLKSSDQNVINNSRASLAKWIIAVAAHEMGHHPGDQDDDHLEGALMSSSMLDVSLTNPEASKFAPSTIKRFRTCERWSK